MIFTLCINQYLSTKYYKHNNKQYRQIVPNYKPFHSFPSKLIQFSEKMIVVIYEKLHINICLIFISIRSMLFIIQENQLPSVQNAKLYLFGFYIELNREIRYPLDCHCLLLYQVKKIKFHRKWTYAYLHSKRSFIFCT